MPLFALLVRTVRTGKVSRQCTRKKITPLRRSARTTQHTSRTAVGHWTAATSHSKRHRQTSPHVLSRCSHVAAVVVLKLGYQPNCTPGSFHSTTCLMFW